MAIQRFWLAKTMIS